MCLISVTVYSSGLALSWLLNQVGVVLFLCLADTVILLDYGGISV